METGSHRSFHLVLVVVLLFGALAAGVGPALGQSGAGNNTTDNSTNTSADGADGPNNSSSDSLFSIGNGSNSSPANATNATSGNKTSAGNTSAANGTNATNGYNASNTTGSGGGGGYGGGGGFGIPGPDDLSKAIIGATINELTEPIRKLYAQSLITALQIAVGQGVDIQSIRLDRELSGPLQALYNIAKGQLGQVALIAWGGITLITVLLNAILPKGLPLSYVFQERLLRFVQVVLGFFIGVLWFAIPREIAVALIPEWQMIASSGQEITAQIAGTGFAVLVIYLFLGIPTLVALGIAILAHGVAIAGIVARPIFYALKTPGEGPLDQLGSRLLAAHPSACLYPFWTSLIMSVAFSADEFARGTVGPVAGLLGLQFQSIWYAGMFMLALYVPAFLFFGSFFGKTGSLFAALAGASLLDGDDNEDGSDSSTSDTSSTDDPSALPSGSGSSNLPVPTSAEGGTDMTAVAGEGPDSPGASTLGNSSPSALAPGPKLVPGPKVTGGTGAAGSSAGAGPTPSGGGSASAASAGGVGAGSASAGGASAASSSSTGSFQFGPGSSQSGSGSSRGSGTNSSTDLDPMVPTADRWSDLDHDVQMPDRMDEIDMDGRYHIGFFKKDGSFQPAREGEPANAEALFDPDTGAFPRAANAYDKGTFVAQDLSGEFVDPRAAMERAGTGAVSPTNGGASDLDLSNGVMDDVVNSNSRWE